MKLQLARDVTPDECSWLKRNFRKGEIVYEYTGCTYGCVSFEGTACCEVEGEDPFFELPTNALTTTEADLVIAIVSKKRKGSEIVDSFPVTQFKTEEELQQAINKTTDCAELIEVIYQNGGVMTNSIGMSSARKFCASLIAVVFRGYPESYVTRTYGLRDKAIKLRDEFNNNNGIKL